MVDQMHNGVNPEMLSCGGFVHNTASDLVDQMSKEFSGMSVNGLAQNTINSRNYLTNEIDQFDENSLVPRSGGISTEDNVIAAVHASTCQVVGASDGIAVNRDLSTDDGTCQLVIDSAWYHTSFVIYRLMTSHVGSSMQVMVSLMVS